MELTEKEKKALKDFDSKKARFAGGLVMFVPIFLLIMAVLNFYLANRIGSYDGINIIDIFFDWIEGIDTTKNYTYTGWHLKAQDRFHTGLMQLSLAIIMGAFVFTAGKQRKMLRKIIEILKSHKEL